MLQADGQWPPKKRWDSWYDRGLVIAKGEKLLEEIDDKAIKEIRRQKLAWKYWDLQSELNIEPFSAGAVIGLRSLTDVDHEKLARFAISILWRAGASDRDDMAGFTVPDELLVQAKAVVLGEAVPRPETFPIKVLQFGTKGFIHNLTPMNHAMNRPDGLVEPFFRIFLNGLIFQIVDTTAVERFDMGNAGWYLGNGSELKILCLDFEASAQAEFMYSMIDHSMSKL